MNSPMRVVCEGCLRSIELDSGISPGGQMSCPACGWRVDHGLSGLAASDVDTRVHPGPAGPPSPDTPETIDWAATWNRGTLGSIGRFQLRERLGDGGFGQVYLAYDPRLDRDVAIKVLRQPEPTDRVMERFFREARAVARLDHPNIVPVHDAGYDDGRCWVAYQFVSGRPLWWYRDRQRMDPATAARIVRDLADALNHAHGMGVVHRDIKPGNVLIDDAGHPRLIDFGLARRKDVESDLTREGVIVGTPAYMSPEQAGGMSKQADERSDVYSLGILFYELLCGRRPHEPQLDAEEGRSERVETPTKAPTARSINPAVPAALDAICTRAMSPRPEDRYPSARALAEAVDRWLARRGSDRRLAALLGSSLLLVGVAVWGLLLTGVVPGYESLAGGGRPPTTRTATNVSPPGTRAPSGGKTDYRNSVSILLVAGTRVASDGSRDAVYHIFPCPKANAITLGHVITFHSDTDAVAHGFHLCATCKSAQTKGQRPSPARPTPSGT
jgi:serine/threonine protein kinase